MNKALKITPAMRANATMVFVVIAGVVLALLWVNASIAAMIGDFYHPRHANNAMSHGLARAFGWPALILLTAATTSALIPQRDKARRVLLICAGAILLAAGVGGTFASIARPGPQSYRMTIPGRIFVIPWTFAPNVTKDSSGEPVLVLRYCTNPLRGIYDEDCDDHLALSLGRYIGRSLDARTANLIASPGRIDAAPVGGLTGFAIPFGTDGKLHDLVFLENPALPVAGHVVICSGFGGDCQHSGRIGRWRLSFAWPRDQTHEWRGARTRLVTLLGSFALGSEHLPRRLRETE